MRPQPLIAVLDVEASSRWYQRLLGCQSAHGGDSAAVGWCVARTAGQGR